MDISKSTFYSIYNSMSIVVPDNVPAPTAISRTPASVEVSWEPPESPNGVISLYTLERREAGTFNSTTVVSVTADSVLRYVDEDSSLSPYHVYEYRVLASNSAGDTPSPWTKVTTMSSSMYYK